MGTTDDDTLWGGSAVWGSLGIACRDPSRFQTGDHTISAWNLLLLGHGKVKEGLWAGTHRLGQPGHEFQWLWVSHKEGLQGF